MSDQGRFLLRVPATATGYKFVEKFKKYTNTEEYRVVVRFSGKRTTNPYSTKKEDATSLRLYLEPRKGTDRSWWECDYNSHNPFAIEMERRKIENERNELQATLDHIEELVLKKTVKIAHVQH